MTLTAPYGQNNYMGEYANDAACLTFIQAQKWDSTKNGSGNPENGMWYYNTTDHLIHEYRNGAWLTEFNTNGAELILSDGEGFYADSDYVYAKSKGGVVARLYDADASADIRVGQLQLQYYSLLPAYNVWAKMKAALIGTTESAMYIEDYLKLTSGTHINEFSTDGTLAGNSDLAVPTEKAVKTYADLAIKKTESIQVAAFRTHVANGASYASVYCSPRIVMPSADADASCFLSFHIPSWFPTGKVKVRIKFYVSSGGTYSVGWYAACYTNGTAITTIAYNVLNNDTSKDFIGASANIVYLNAVTITDADIVPGSTFTLQITSDASNARELHILDAWIEPDFT